MILSLRPFSLGDSYHKHFAEPIHVHAGHDMVEIWGIEPHTFHMQTTLYFNASLRIVFCFLFRNTTENQMLAVQRNNWVLVIVRPTLHTESPDYLLCLSSTGRVISAEGIASVHMAGLVCWTIRTSKARVACGDRDEMGCFK